MVNMGLGILYGVLAVILPVIALASWSFVFVRLFPYARKEFQKVVFLKGSDDSLRYIVIGMIPVFFIAASLVAAGISVVIGLFFRLILYLIDPSLGPITQTIEAMSAGPIEESAKLSMALLIYLTFYWIWRKVPWQKHDEVKRDTVKDGMVFGLFVGASFGFLESLLYLFFNFIGLASFGFSYETMNPIIWRFVLGVMIHAMYTSIASAGLGRKTMNRKLVVTAIVLGISIILHALNNGVHGFILFVMDLGDKLGLILVDVIQITLVIIGLVIFVALWRTSKRF
jgi:RsiW-degrading membrane proteinase PrsW (M82 family)